MTKLRSFEESLPMALLNAREATMELFRPSLARHDLTEQQWRVLRSLGSHDQPVDAGTIVEATSLQAPSLSRILANLSERELINRESASDDQRRAVISLAPAGAALVKTVAPESEATYAEIERLFGSDRLKSLFAELSDLAETLHESQENGRN